MYPQDPNFKSIFMGDDSEKPSDMADDTVLSPDGVNPVSKNPSCPATASGSRSPAQSRPPISPAFQTVRFKTPFRKKSFEKQKQAF